MNRTCSSTSTATTSGNGSAPLNENLVVASFFASGNHVIAVGTLVQQDSYGAGVLIEIDQAGAAARQLRFASNVSVLSASRADSGRVDVLLHSGAASSFDPLLVQLAP